MKAKVFYDEDGQVAAICFTLAQVEAASDALYTPGARFTVREEERYGLIGSDCCVKCGEQFTESRECCCDSGTHIDGSHDDGHCKDCCPNSHTFYPWPTYERAGCEA